MTLTPEAKDRYPLFEKWLRKDFVHVVNNSRLMKAFWRWSDFTDTTERRSIFKYGTAPAIGLLDDGTSKGCTYNTDGTPSGFLYAMTWSAKMIGINTVLLDLFETVFPEPEPDTDVHYARTVGFRRQVIEVVEGTILHEMVHWSYFVTGKDEEKLHGGDKEHGTKNFEMEAYGNYLSLPHSRLCANISPSAYLGIQWEQRVQDTGKEVRSVVTVTGVDLSSPAGKVGIKQGDVITDFDSQGIWPEGLSAQLRKKKPGDQITIKGYRRTSTTTSVTSGSTSNFTYNVTLGTGAGK
jgi:PDZ domain/Metallopeptidase toxin 3